MIRHTSNQCFNNVPAVFQVLYTRINPVWPSGLVSLPGLFLFHSFPENKMKATAVIKVDIESLTGKQSGFA